MFYCNLIIYAEHFAFLSFLFMFKWFYLYFFFYYFFYGRFIPRLIGPVTPLSRDSLECGIVCLSVTPNFIRRSV